MAKKLRNQSMLVTIFQELGVSNVPLLVVAEHFGLLGKQSMSCMLSLRSVLMKRSHNGSEFKRVAEKTNNQAAEIQHDHHDKGTRRLRN